VPDHLMNHLTIKPRQNGLDNRHGLEGLENRHDSADILDGHHHLLGHGGDLMTDNMLGHMGEQETMMMNHTPLSPLAIDNHNEDMKLPTRKEKDSYLKKYAKKLGLNDRGCYLAIALAIIAFFFLVIIIAMAASWPNSHLRYTGSIALCSTPACLEASSSIVSAYNNSLEPCTNMWEFSCGSWVSRNGIPETRSRWDRIEQTKYRTRQTKSRLISMFSHEPSQINSIEWKVQNFYDSCKTLMYIEQDKEKPLMKIINNIGGWDVLRSFNLYNWDMHRVLRQLHSQFGVNAFFRVDVVPDVQISGQNIIQVSPDGLGMPDKTYYHRFPNDSAIQAYQTYMKDAAMLFGAPSPEAHKFAIDIFNFEKRIAEITPSSTYMNDPIKVNNKMKVKDLQTMSMNVPWLEVLKACYPNAQISETTEVVMVNPQYAADIAVIMSTTDRASLNNYLVWRMVQTYMPYLSKPYREVQDLYRKFLTGAQKPLSRWEFCEETTERFFGHLLDAIFYLEQGVTEERKISVQRIFDRIRDSVLLSISMSDQFDYHGRQAAITKIRTMTIQVGTPSLLRDRKFLKLMYKDISVQKQDFFQNMLYGTGFLRKWEEHSLVSPGDESRWMRNLQLDTVSFVPTANKVVVPELLLQQPLFHPGYPPSINLGGLGAKIAVAVVDGVVGKGSVFTASGRIMDGQEANFTLSRPAEAGATLRDGAKCLKNKWQNMRLDTPDHLDKSAMDSAVSVAGAKAAYGALGDILSVDGGKLLPALQNLDPQAIFFLEYSQSFCEQSTLQQRDIDRTVNQHLLGREKLEGVLSQFADFRHFFYCTENDENSCGNVL